MFRRAIERADARPETGTTARPLGVRKIEEFWHASGEITDAHVLHGDDNITACKSTGSGSITDFAQLR